MHTSQVTAPFAGTSRHRGLPRLRRKQGQEEASRGIVAATGCSWSHSARWVSKVLVAFVAV